MEIVSEWRNWRPSVCFTHFQEWLPGMHPYEDYKISHASQMSQCGGVIMCLSHEIDMAYWLFGEPKGLMAFSGKISDMVLGMADWADMSLIYERLDSKRCAYVNLDYLSKR